MTRLFHKKIMLDIVLEKVTIVHSLHLRIGYLVEQFARFRYIRCLDLSQPFRFCRFRKSVELDMSLHRHVSAQVRELHLDQLLWIQGTMPVSNRGYTIDYSHKESFHGF